MNSNKNKNEKFIFKKQFNRVVSKCRNAILVTRPNFRLFFIFLNWIPRWKFMVFYESEGEGQGQL